MWRTTCRFADNTRDAHVRQESFILYTVLPAVRHLFNLTTPDVGVAGATGMNAHAHAHSSSSSISGINTSGSSQHIRSASYLPSGMRACSLSLSLFVSLSHSLSLSLSLSHTHTLSLSLALSLPLYLSLSFFISLSLSLSFFLSLSFSLSLLSACIGQGNLIHSFCSIDSATKATGCLATKATSCSVSRRQGTPFRTHNIETFLPPCVRVKQGRCTGFSLNMHTVRQGRCTGASLNRRAGSLHWTGVSFNVNTVISFPP